MRQLIIQSVIINYIFIYQMFSEKFTSKWQKFIACWGCNMSECCSFYLSIELHLLFGDLGCITSRMKNTFVCNRVHCYKRVSLSFAIQKKGNKNIKPYSLNCIERLTKFLYPFHSHSLQTLFCSIYETFSSYPDLCQSLDIVQKELQAVVIRSEEKSVWSEWLWKGYKNFVRLSICS